MGLSRLTQNEAYMTRLQETLIWISFYKITLITIKNGLLRKGAKQLRPQYYLTSYILACVKSWPTKTIPLILPPLITTTEIRPGVLYGWCWIAGLWWLRVIWLGWPGINRV